MFSLMAVARDGAADVVNIKISKFGGLTRAKQAVDLCSELGIAMTIEGESQGARKLTLTHIVLDTWGGDITTAAILQIANTAPDKLQFTATDFNSCNKGRCRGVVTLVKTLVS